MYNLILFCVSVTLPLAVDIAKIMRIIKVNLVIKVAPNGNIDVAIATRTNTHTGTGNYFFCLAIVFFHNLYDE